MEKIECFNKMISESKSTKQRLLFSAIKLFSDRGYSNVGIRELCRSLDIKESAFYNHYKSKEELFSAMLAYFVEISGKAEFSSEDIMEIVDTGNIGLFLKKAMKAYIEAIENPLYGALLQIVLMESYTNADAYKLAITNDYYLYTQQLLQRMMDKGTIKRLDASAVTASYYYALKGIMQEYLIRKAWGEDIKDVIQKINDHVDLFVALLKI